MPNYPPLSELRAAIRQAGYRMDSFAEMVGERPDYFSRMLAGGRPPKKGLFERASAILKRPQTELLPSTRTPHDCDHSEAAA